jgi:hypothetical protein
MAAKRKKTKRAGDGSSAARKEERKEERNEERTEERNEERSGLVPPANGPVRRRAGVGRGQAAPQARRYAFRRS